MSAAPRRYLEWHSSEVSPTMCRVRIAVAGMLILLGPLAPGRLFGQDDVPKLELKERWSLPIKHDKDLRAMVFSSDGKLLLTASEDCTARLWETASGRPINHVFRHGDIIKDAAISSDGKLVATASRDGSARLWDVKTGMLVGRIMRHLAPVNALTFSADNKFLLTGSDDATARVWDTSTGDLARGILQHDNPVGHVFSLNAKTVVTISHEQILKWDIPSGKVIGRLCPANLGATALSISQDGWLFVTASRNRGVQLWEMATGKAMCDPIAPDVYFIDIAFTTDSKTFVTAGRVKGGPATATCVQFWDTETLKPIGEPMTGQDCFAIHPNGKILATGTPDGRIKLWSVTIHPPRAKPVIAQSVEELWSDLANEETPKAYRAVVALTAMSDKTVPFLAGRLKPEPPLDDNRVRKLISDLDDDEFEVRDRAQKELAAFGQSIDPILRATLDSKPPLEARQRIQQILDPLQAIPKTQEQMRLLRALEVLERIASPESKVVLTKIANGAATAEVTRVAKESLARLSKNR